MGPGSSTDNRRLGKCPYAMRFRLTAKRQATGVRDAATASHPISLHLKRSRAVLSVRHMIDHLDHFKVYILGQ